VCVCVILCIVVPLPLGRKLVAVNNDDDYDDDDDNNTMWPTSGQGLL
jgi:hypothetical protein